MRKPTKLMLPLLIVYKISNIVFLRSFLDSTAACIANSIFEFITFIESQKAKHQLKLTFCKVRSCCSASFIYCSANSFTFEYSFLCAISVCRSKKYTLVTFTQRISTTICKYSTKYYSAYQKYS